jgi:hypothetical protein
VKIDLEISGRGSEVSFGRDLELSGKLVVGIVFVSLLR